MKKKLAIICASKGQLPMVNKAKEMGIETFCFAWDKDEHSFCKGIADYFYPISILEKEQILEKCREIGIDGVSSIMNDYAVPTVAYVAQNMGLTGNSYDDMLIAGNKFKARLAYLKNGVNSPRFTIAYKKENTDLSEFQYPLIVKPTDRCASVGVLKIDNETELWEAVLRALQVSYTKETIIEEFISGSEATLDMITWQGKHYPIIISDTETTGEPYYTKTGYHQPSKLGNDIQAKIISEAKKALDALNFQYGASDIEVKVTETGEVKIIEINPRMGADATEKLVRLSTGYDLVKGSIDIALGKFETPLFPLKKYSGVYFCTKNTEKLRQAIDNKENDPDIVETVIYPEEDEALGRIGYLIYQSDRKRVWSDSRNN